MKTPYRCLSYGGGVQSSAMLVAACHGDLPDGVRPDVVIFADTQWEPVAVTDHVHFMTEYAAKYGIKVVTVTHGPIRSKRGASTMPLFTRNEGNDKGITLRQCTVDYKVNPIRKEIRRLLGYAPRKPLKHDIEIWLGISIDEAQRMKPSRATRTVNRWPLIEMEWSREKCKRYIEQHNLPVPMKSSCIGCPYHSNKYFLDMKRQRPNEWNDVVLFDKQIRNEFKSPILKGTAYVHRNAEPLEKVYLQEDQIELFGEECSGYCEA